MKSKLLLPKLFLLLTTCFASCENMTFSSGDDGDKIKVKGDGIVTIIARETGAFNQVALEGVFNVILTQSDKEGVKVETDENIEPFILTSVTNNVLTVKMKDSISIGKMKKINIYISFKDISKLSTTGVGSLKCSDKLNLNELELLCNGVGATSLNLSAARLTIKSEVVGILILKGNVGEVNIHHNGVGMIQAFDLKAEKLNLHTEGVGAAEVYASKELTINASGLGGIQYKGNPPIKQIKNEGIGKVVSVE